MTKHLMAKQGLSPTQARQAVGQQPGALDHRGH